MILVTGGAGYLGSVLVPDLLALGETVRVVDCLWFGSTLPLSPRLEIIEADLRACNPAWLDGVDSVIHLSGLSNDPTADFAPLLTSESNVMATRTLAEAAAERARRDGGSLRFLFASSCSVYYAAADQTDLDVELMTEDTAIAPTANYSKTKRLAELDLLRLAALEPLFCPVMLRMGTLFGYAPRMRFDLVVNTFTLDAWSRRRIVVHGSGEAWRPLLHVQDAADAYVHLLHAPAESVRAQTFNAVHKNYRILELAHWVAEILKEHRGVSVQVKRDRSVRTGNRSYYVLGEKLRCATGFRPDRGTTEAVLRIWDALETGSLGAAPDECSRFFNIRALRERFAGEVLA